jgi:hypothetical protein
MGQPILGIFIFCCLALGCSPKQPENTVLGATDEVEYKFETLAKVFPGIHGLAIDENDVIYLADTFGNFHPERRIYSLEPPYTGQFNTLPIKASQPGGLAFVGDHLFVCDLGLNRITEFDQQFKPIRKWNADAPWTVRSIGGMLTTINAGGALETLDDTGQTNVLFEGMVNPFSFHAAGSDTFWVSEQGSEFSPSRVTERTMKGEILREVGSDWKVAEGLHLDQKGRLWIADTGANGLFLFENNKVKKIGPNMDRPIIISQFTNGDLLVVEGGPSARLIRVSF